MRKIFLGILISFVLFVPQMMAFAANVEMKIDGVRIASDVSPEIINNRTMVPLRVISENLGATVEWENSLVTMTKDDMEIVINVKTSVVTKNGEFIALDAKPYIKNDCTMVPIRFIAESFGSHVNYKNGVVTIETHPLMINNQVVKGLQKQTENVLGSTIYQLEANSYIKDIYQMYVENKGEKTNTPHYAKYDFSIPGTYYKIIDHKFINTDDQVLQHFAVYQLYDQFSAELLEGYANYLLHDVTTNEWYIFDDNTVNSLENMIQKARSNDLFDLISTNL